ncbi:hypothetical protein CDL15_Pgr018695 [Punica granatum]|nr:hypothetical protein CDL15_Pgr018693 [Punica granatum]OWM64124.1 hypothetical protein CDL15_Pgr018695 [Punica granatum]
MLLSRDLPSSEEKIRKSGLWSKSGTRSGLVDPNGEERVWEESWLARTARVVSPSRVGGSRLSKGSWRCSRMAPNGRLPVLTRKNTNRPG